MSNLADVVLFFALEEELEQAYKFLKADGATCWVDYHSKSAKEYLFEYSERGNGDFRVLITVLGDLGNVKIATQVLPIVMNAKPRACILVGIAGSLDKNKLRLGDVVVSAGVKIIYPDKLKQFDSSKEVFVDQAVGDQKIDDRISVDVRKRFLGESFFRFRRQFLRNDKSLTLLSHYLTFLTKEPVVLEPVLQIENLNPNVLETTILGSDFVFDSTEYIQFLNERNVDLSKDYYVQKSNPEDADRNIWLETELLAVDMESYGYFQALEKLINHHGTTTAFSIRGISDYASGKEDLDTEHSTDVRPIRSVAASNAVLVAVDMIKFLRKKRLLPE